MTESRGRAPVLFLLGTLEIGGSETKFVRLANRLRQSGMPVHIAYLRPPDALLEKIEGVPTQHLNQLSKWSQTAYKNLQQYVRANQIRSIVNVNLYPLVYSVPLSRFHADLGLRVVTSINTSEIMSVRERRFMHLYKRLLRRCSSLVFGSARQMNDWVTRYHLSADNSVVAYNGVDGVMFSPDLIDDGRRRLRTDLGIPNDAFALVCVSQFRPEKGHENLLRAVAEIRRTRGEAPYVILVGDGAERGRIEGVIAAENLEDRVVLTGAVSDVRPYLQSADLFVLPSTAVETFSNAALEAGAMGLPAVISDLGGAHEMFPPGSGCGAVYDRRSIAALREILQERYDAGPPDEARRQAVRNETLARFDVSKMDRCWQSILWPECEREVCAT